MSKAAASGQVSEDDARELEATAAELYGRPPDAFAAARDERVRDARSNGRQQLAKELSRLRRPTQSAWLINLLWRDQREVMEQFLQLGQELSRAQAEASGPELHRLTTLRRQLESALIRTGRALAQSAGVNVGASMEREAQETLSAALARPEVADEVRTGRLLKPASYAGFGAGVASGTMRAPAPGARQPGPAEAAQTAADTPAREIDERAARAAQRARERREAAEQAVQDARSTLELAAQAVAEQSRAAASAEQQHITLRQELEEREAQVRELEERLREAQQALAGAAHRKEQADKAHEAALRTLARAEQELQQAQAMP